MSQFSEPFDTWSIDLLTVKRSATGKQVGLILRSKNHLFHYPGYALGPDPEEDVCI